MELEPTTLYTLDRALYQLSYRGSSAGWTQISHLIVHLMYIHVHVPVQYCTRISWCCAWSRSWFGPTSVPAGSMPPLSVCVQYCWRGCCPDQRLAATSDCWWSRTETTENCEHQTDIQYTYIYIAHVHWNHNWNIHVIVNSHAAVYTGIFASVEMMGRALIFPTFTLCRTLYYAKKSCDLLSMSSS